MHVEHQLQHIDPPRSYRHSHSPDCHNARSNRNERGRTGGITCAPDVQHPTSRFSGDEIYLEAFITCYPHPPQHAYFKLILMKIDDYGNETVHFSQEFDNANYDSPVGYHVFASYYCSTHPGTRWDSYYAILKGALFHGDSFSNTPDVYTEPPQRIFC
ncbi:hypothetical protein [Nocardia brasiliensis]|uniref:hypothetical protein n=1 Tax=Nocardia brasiliensis TaxID=37326 RepID=UPI003D8EE3DE